MSNLKWRIESVSCDLKQKPQLELFRMDYRKQGEKVDFQVMADNGKHVPFFVTWEKRRDVTKAVKAAKGQKTPGFCMQIDDIRSLFKVYRELKLYAVTETEKKSVFTLENFQRFIRIIRLVH